MYEELATAVGALAGQDADHAEESNGVGFNKGDTWFGASLATLPTLEWTPEVAFEAWEMLRKYRGQLSTHGIDYDAIPKPPRTDAGFGKTRREMLEPIMPEYRDAARKREQDRAEREARRLLALNRRLMIESGTTLGGEVFVLVLGKNRPDALMQMVRDIPGRKWGSGRADFGWEAPMTSGAAKAIQQIVDAYGWEISDEMRDDGVFITDPDTMSHLEMLCGSAPAAPVNPRQCRLVGDELVFSWSYEDPDFSRIVTAIKSLNRSHRRYEPSERSWHVVTTDPLTMADAVTIATKYGFEIDPQIDAAAIKRIASERSQGARAEAQAANERERQNLALQTAKDADLIDYELDIDDFKRDLFGFQRAAVRYAIDNLKPGKGLIVGDDMGLGKTVESIAIMHTSFAYPVLVVTTASVKYQFEDEWHTVLPEKRTFVVNGKGLEPGYDVVLINYDILGKHLDALKGYGFKGLVIDEMHRCKSRKAQRTKNVRELAKVIPFVIGLTGTVTENRMAELEQPLTIVNRLDDLGGWRHFIYDVCGGFHNGFGLQFPDPRKMGREARDEYLGPIKDFNRKMRAVGAYIRRETDDVIDIPSMENRIVPVDIDNRSEYDRARRDIVEYAARLAEEDKEFLRSIKGLPEDEQKRLKRERREDAAVKAERAEVLVRINALKQITARGKMQSLKDYVESFVEVGRKVVVMCWHREVADEMARTFKAPAIIGGVDAETKFRFQQEFNEDPDCMVIVCNIIAASEGLNLTAAADVIFAEQGWNPSKMDQAARRIRRIGQTRPTTQHHVVGRNTIDEALVGLIRGKKLVTSAGNTGEVIEDEVTVGDVNYILKSLTGDDLEIDEAA